MDTAAFLASLKAGELNGQIFLFAGRESFLKERALEQVKARFVPPDEQAESYYIIDFEHREVTDFQTRLNSFSFSSGRRVFALYQFDKLSSAERKQVYAVLKQPIPEDALVFLLTDEASIATEVVKSLADLVLRLDFWPPFENQLPAWIRQEAADAGAQMSLEAAQMLLERVGGDLRALSQEIKKLALRVGKNGRIGVAEIEAGVRYMRQDTVFDWIEAIGRKDLPRALRILEGLLMRGEAIQRLWFQLVDTLRNYRLVLDSVVDRPDLMQPLLARWQSLRRLEGRSDFRANQERKQIVEEMSPLIERLPLPLVTALNLHVPHQVRNLCWATSFSGEHLASLWPIMEDVDEALKSSVPNPELVLQRFLVRLLR